MNSSKGSSEKPEGEQEVESEKGLPSSYCTVYVLILHDVQVLIRDGVSSMLNDEPVSLFVGCLLGTTDITFRYTRREANR